MQAFSTARQMDMIPPGSKMAPKVLTIIYYVEHGKPYVLLGNQGIEPVRGIDGTEGRGKG